MFAPWHDSEAGRDWWIAARCNDGVGGLAPLFFSEQLDDIATAKELCAECPVAQPCLEGALSRREPWGVWGGQLVVTGRVLAHKLRRGRPPKHGIAVEGAERSA